MILLSAPRLVFVPRLNVPSRISKVDSFRMKRRTQCYRNDQMMVISSKCRIRMRASRGVKLGFFFNRLCLASRLALRAYAYDFVCFSYCVAGKKTARNINAMRIGWLYLER